MGRGRWGRRSYLRNSAGVNSVVFYVNFENATAFQSLFRSGLRPVTVIPQLSILLNETIIPDQDQVIFDEVQCSKEALTSLKYFREEMPELALCCAVSRGGQGGRKSPFAKSCRI